MANLTTTRRSGATRSSAGRFGRAAGVPPSPRGVLVRRRQPAPSGLRGLGTAMASPRRAAPSRRPGRAGAAMALLAAGAGMLLGRRRRASRDDEPPRPIG